MSRPESDSDGQSVGKTTRQKLIEEAQLRCHEARSELQKAKLLYGTVPREVALRLQQRIADYYYALRPLRNEDPVADWWDDGPLSKHWIKDVRIEKEPVVTGDYLGQESVGVRQRKKKVIDRYQGLDHLEQLDSMTETKTVTKSGMRGTRKEKSTRQKALDAEILRDLSSTLDDAATKLGFGPEIETEMPTDETDLEDLKGDGSLATIPQGERPDLEEFNVDVGGD